jgi:large subunit ribosomal protein L29
MKFKELKDKTKKELLENLHNFKREQMNLRFQKAAGEAIKGSRVNLLRKSIARIKTLLSQNNLEDNANA